jgi:hypothetical protein
LAGQPGASASEIRSFRGAARGGVDLPSSQDGRLPLIDGAMSLDLGPQTRAVPLVFFERRELDRLLQLYGLRVAAGEWRDYAIDGLSDMAMFSVYRRASEAPAYRIEKRPALARRQGQWAIIGQNGQVLKRGRELDAVLRFFDRGRFRVVK